ncbi:MAG TPA: hydrogenase expression/formation protein HypE [Bacteroidales bacterium]|jgi:hydrogenase expression/formation protein HypE|nr:hydrogenase expression/formation protein HypE [Bacteroidales bacterium]HNZ42847.1 hydrogenase expression/formation protein HypE [Bacteroidales bacterium]HPB24486.1 hydrogenase expression/formation protein HypE [Bacteroidales bacterium]HPI30550.1 hydrogenase expression/formation protein HypE [Bacteroidales bacterium]HQN15029.1 hydrogenase expression/formation protein HypE [Bacteroidales bacterium]
MENKTILLGHGSGGRLSHELIRELFYKYFSNAVLAGQSDSALLQIDARNIAFTTDSYVVDPIFFNGGNIGKLAVCGTVNDLAVSGAVPKYISAGFIIEEGLAFDDLKSIVASMADEAQKAGVIIVTGDTKVVNKGQCDKVFINTSGIGLLDEKHQHISSGNTIKPGDKILINGSIADHGMTIMAARNFENFNTDIHSDCAPLNHMIHAVLNAGCSVKFMRDATRGGIATVLCELAEHNNLGIEINESAVLIKENVRGICELLGFDPFYVANEGKVLMVVDCRDADKALQIMKQNDLGKEASIIGTVVNESRGKAILKTTIGGKRIMDMLAGEQLPRIC